MRLIAFLWLVPALACAGSQGESREADRMVYDDASWHYEGDFPPELPPEAAATHSGMFVSWAILNGLGGELHTVDLPDDLADLRARSLTPGEFLVDRCDEKLTSEDLNEEGNAFAKVYFNFKSGVFPLDYDQALVGDLPSIYHVADTWQNYDTLAPLLSERLRQWRAGAFRGGSQPAAA